MLRDAPAATGKLLAAMAYGTECVVLDGESGPLATIGGVSGRWIRVRYLQWEGWAFGGFLNLSPVNAERLTGTRWVPYANDLGWGPALEFSADGSCELVFQAGGGGSLKGTWRLEGGEVVITVGERKTPGGLAVWSTGQIWRGRYRKTADNISYGWGLVLTEAKGATITVLDQSRPCVAGEIIIIDGMRISVAGRAQGVTTDNARIRDKPRPDGKPLSYRTPLPTQFLDHVPAGTRLVILARTVDTMVVQRWRNVWYMVEVDQRDGLPPTLTGWIFGEFIKMD